MYSGKLRKSVLTPTSLSILVPPPVKPSDYQRHALHQPKSSHSRTSSHSSKSQRSHHESYKIQPKILPSKKNIECVNININTSAQKKAPQSIERIIDSKLLEQEAKLIKFFGQLMEQQEIKMNAKLQHFKQQMREQQRLQESLIFSEAPKFQQCEDEPNILETVHSERRHESISRALQPKKFTSPARLLVQQSKHKKSCSQFELHNRPVLTVNHEVSFTNFKGLTQVISPMSCNSMTFQDKDLCDVDEDQSDGEKSVQRSRSSISRGARSMATYQKQEEPKSKAKCTCKIKLDTGNDQKLQILKEKVTCGHFCKFLAPERQKAIIENLLVQTQGSLQIKAAKGNLGDKKYLVAADWWRQWSDYVNFNNEQPAQQKKQKEDFSGDTFHNELLSLKLNVSAQSHQLYMRPGTIQNAFLLQSGNCLKLNQNLMEHYDYEAVNAQVWKYIYAWYSADWCIQRFLKLQQAQLVLNLYPELKEDSEGGVQQD